MKNIILAVLFILSIGFGVKAEPTPTVQRQELFVRAYKSLSFLMEMARLDSTFYNQLSADEKLMFDSVNEVVKEVTTVNWLLKNHVERVVYDGSARYLHVVYPNLVLQFATKMVRPPQIQFSNDQSRFILDPLQPGRSGMTVTAIDGDIFINEARINDALAQIDFASAISLLIHEFGHKVGAKKNQIAIDSAAAQMEKYIRSTTSTVIVAGKKVNTLSFENFPFKEWAQSMLFGQYEGKDKPRTPLSFSVFDEQGLIVWVEDHNKVTDLTESVFRTAAKTKLISYEAQPGFRYLRQNVMRPGRVHIDTLLNGDFKIAADFWLSELTVPFLNEGPSGNKIFQIFERSFKTVQPWVEKVVAQEFTFSQENYSLKKNKEFAPMIEAPSFKIEYLDKKLRGKNLEIFFSIKGNRLVEGGLMPGEKNKEAWPEIIVMINSSKLILKATNYYEDSDEFKFVLKDFESVQNSDIKITGVQLKLKNKYLMTNSDFTIKTFLPAEVTLNRKKADSAQVLNTPTIKSMQIWNGKQWLPLRNKTTLQRGQHLRIILQSSEYLRELNLEQIYDTVFQSKVIEGGFEDTVFKYSNKRDLRFTEENMRQTQKDGMLYVDLNIDQDIVTEVKPGVEEIDWYLNFIGRTKGDLLSLPDNKRTLGVSTSEQRGLQSISFVTASGLSQEIEFKNLVSFEKSPGDDKPDDTSLRFKTVAAKKVRCEKLF